MRLSLKRLHIKLLATVEYFITYDDKNFNLGILNMNNNLVHFISD